MPWKPVNFQDHHMNPHPHPTAPITENTPSVKMRNRRKHIQDDLPIKKYDTLIIIIH